MTTLLVYEDDLQALVVRLDNSDPSGFIPDMGSGDADPDGPFIVKVETGPWLSEREHPPIQPGEFVFKDYEAALDLFENVLRASHREARAFIAVNRARERDAALLKSAAAAKHQD